MDEESRSRNELAAEVARLEKELKDTRIKLALARIINRDLQLDKERLEDYERDAAQLRSLNKRQRE